MTSRTALKLVGRPIRAALRQIGLDIVRYEVITPDHRHHAGLAPAPPPSIGGVRDRFPFPADVSVGETFLPAEPPNGRDLVEDLIRDHDAKVLLEIGAFLGGSTIRWLRASDQLFVIAIDPWEDGWAGEYLASIGHPEQQEHLHQQDGLYEMFLRNLKPYAERLAVIRDHSPSVLDELARLGLQPDIVFIDSTKQTADLATAAELWPQAILTGDDWSWEGDDVGRMADIVLRFAAARGLTVVRRSETWAIQPRR